MLNTPSPSASLSVTLGTQTYTVDRDWGGLSERKFTDVISDITILDDGRVAVLLRGQRAIRCFDVNGTEIESPYNLPVMDGHGITADRDGLIVVDRDRHEIVRLNKNGTIHFRLGNPGKPAWRLPFSHPTAVARGRNEQLFVTDGYGNGRVHVFSPEQDYLYSFGEIGTAPGQFLNPHAITFHMDGRVVIADRDNNRIQLFHEDGTLSEVWEGFWRPMGIATLKDGTIIVSDQSPALHALSAKGEHIGRARPANDWPHGVAASTDGCIYMVDMHPTSITRMMPLNGTQVDS